ncbi:carbohydate-binding domain-containing protein [Fibrella sp. HMF5335]|uniref:beta-N-acetylhexosaminidase n=1 Tax=Fibrella rubiginis TaxID=2817060 RepID=A0A939K884_9BACT|nr:family 20 glycosylhydrolase [Fibrella rubiginis]MBO0939460.1 carbohydate-binding domain-containing protein [Fibrella rubiginis]
MRPVVLLLLCLFSLTSHAQNGSKPLTLTWELVDNNHQNQGRSRSVLTLTNTGTSDLPASGWKLFFNGGSYESADPAKAGVNHYNGDLWYLSPGTGFAAVPAGQSAPLTVLSRRLRNRTDFPRGFYIVFDKDPARAFPVAVTTRSGTLFDKSDRALAERFFVENERIKPVAANALPAVFPTPATYRATGNSFVLDASVVIVSPGEFANEAGLLSAGLMPVVGKKLTVAAQHSGKAITLKKNPALAAEGYELVVNQNGIQVSAATGAGVFYGIQSLQTMIPGAALAGKAGSVTLPGVVVTDAPRFGYRAFMMDMARNFQPKSEVLKVLDVMALYKLNTFHFHFSEDEGWRLDIPSLPELTEVGAKRAHAVDESKNLVPAYGSGPSTDNPAGTGFYTKADFIEILKYAHDRHIEVIPEIESPGHARAAIKAMDARYARLLKAGNKADAERYLLHDLADKSVYRSVQGFNDNVMDVSMPSVYAFMERVVDDIRAMYKEAGVPLKTIHFGGDEVPGGVWQKSPSVQQLMAKDPAVKTIDDLWPYYFGKVNQLLKTRGLFLSAWEEVGQRKVKRDGRSVWVPNEQLVAEGFRLNVWNNTAGAEDLAYRLANAGYKVIFSGVTHLYLDLAYTPEYQEPGQYWGGYIDTEKPFSLIPYDFLRNMKDNNGQPISPSIAKSKVSLTSKSRANIVGIEGHLWSETNLTPTDFEYKMLPKLLAVAERAWAKSPAWATETDAAKSNQLYNVALSEFMSTVGRELPRLDVLSGGFAYRVSPPGAKVISGKVAANVPLPGLTIHYTTDGSEPTINSPVYTAPVPAAGTVKLKTFNATGRSSHTITMVN